MHKIIASQVRSLMAKFQEQAMMTRYSPSFKYLPLQLQAKILVYEDKVMVLEKKIEDAEDQELELRLIREYCDNLSSEPAEAAERERKLCKEKIALWRGTLSNINEALQRVISELKNESPSYEVREEESHSGDASTQRLACHIEDNVVNTDDAISDILVDIETESPIPIEDLLRTIKEDTVTDDNISQGFRRERQFISFGDSDSENRCFFYAKDLNNIKRQPELSLTSYFGYHSDRAGYTRDFLFLIPRNYSAKLECEQFLKEQSVSDMMRLRSR